MKRGPKGAEVLKVLKDTEIIQGTEKLNEQKEGKSTHYVKEMAILSSILAWKILWTRSLAGYSPWDCKESDMT